MNLWILFLIIFLIFLLAEVLYRKKIDSFWTRKIVHIGVGSVIAFFPYFLSLKSTLILGVLTSFLIFFLNQKNILKSIFSIKEKSFGARLFVPSLTLLAFLSWDKVFVFTMITLVLAWGDGLAALVGKKFAGKKLYKNKTYLGSSTFLLVSFLIMYIFLSGILNFWIIFLLAFLITLIELLSQKGWDNFFIPLILFNMIYYLLW